MKNVSNSKNEQIFDLKKALHFANGIINTVREPLVVLYPKLVIHSVNKSFYKVFKTDPKNTIGRHIYELGDGQWNIPSLKKLLGEKLIAKKSFKNFQVEHTFETIGHKIMLLNASKMAVRQADDLMTLLAIEDITARKNLEKKVEAEKHIVAQHKQLVELTRHKDEFFFLTSHELRTPLTVIKVYKDLLQKQLEDVEKSDAAWMLVKMNEQIEKLANRITELLDTIKMEGGKLNYNLSYFNFNELVVQSVNEMQLITKHYIMEVNMPETTMVYADKERIEQVILNILSNAIKFSSHNRKIVITGTGGKDCITLSIQDFGIGIPVSKQSKIFERFYRVSGQAEDTYPGIGLGLYLSAEIIKRHQGTLSVKSVKGTGTTFSFTLPLAHIHTYASTTSQGLQAFAEQD